MLSIPRSYLNVSFHIHLTFFIQFNPLFRKQLPNALYTYPKLSGLCVSAWLICFSIPKHSDCKNHKVPVQILPPPWNFPGSQQLELISPSSDFPKNILENFQFFCFVSQLNVIYIKYLNSLCIQELMATRPGLLSPSPVVLIISSSSH